MLVKDLRKEIKDMPNDTELCICIDGIHIGVYAESTKVGKDKQDILEIFPEYSHEVYNQYDED